MKPVICKKKPQGDSLQNQENNNSEKTADEEEYITHKCKVQGTRHKIQEWPIVETVLFIRNFVFLFYKCYIEQGAKTADRKNSTNYRKLLRLVSCTLCLSNALQMDTCHNVSKQYPYHEQHFSADHRQHAREV